MAEPTRVLMVAAANATSGGGEKHVADLLKQFSARDYTLGLVAPAGGALGELAHALGVTTFDASIDRGFSVARVRAVRAAIDAFDPMVVHAHGSRAALFARLADPRARDRVIYTVHGIHVDRAGYAARRAVLLGVERLLRPRTARFVTVCEADLRRGVGLEILDRARSRVVYNGIELPQPAGEPGAFRAELGLSAHTPLMLCVGRLEPQKDHATLISAFERLHARNPDVALACVGSGSLEPQVMQQITGAGLAGSVHVVPPRERIANAYVDAQVAVLSSLWEGLPYTVVEAMAYGLPVVATRVDGIPEAVDSGVSGLLVEPSDPSALAQAMLDVVGDSAKAAEMGREGRQRVELLFSVGRMIDSLDEIYQEVLAS